MITSKRQKRYMNVKVAGRVDNCPRYLPVSGGIPELVNKMRAIGELPPENKEDATIEARSHR